MDEHSTKPLTTWNQDGSFLPEDYVKSKGERRANLLSLSLFGVMMLAVVAAFFATNKKWMNVRDENRSINAMYVQEAAKIDELKALEAQRDELIKKAEVTAALVERVPRSLLFAEIVRRMPDEVKLLEMELESEEIKKASSSAKKSAGVRTLSGAAKAASGANAAEEEESLVPEYRQSLTLVGVGRDNDNIADYIESLKNCSILTGVELQYIKETKIENADLRKFELRARIRNGIDARGLVNPDRPLDLPKTLDPNDLVPAEPIILPPSQLGPDGEPIRAGQKKAKPGDVLGSAMDALKSLGDKAQEMVTPEDDSPEIPWEEIPSTSDDLNADQPAADGETEAQPETEASEVETETETETESESDSESDSENDEGEG